MEPSQGTLTAADQDALSTLEERILRAVDVVNQLRSEKQSLAGEKAQLLSEKQSLEAEVARTHEQMRQLQDELSALRDERQQVKSRVERLLGQLDSISA